MILNEEELSRGAYERAAAGRVDDVRQQHSRQRLSALGVQLWWRESIPPFLSRRDSSLTIRAVDPNHLEPGGAFSARSSDEDGHTFQFDGDKSPHSKRVASTRRVAVPVALLANICIARAQNYSIDWHSIDAGGGTSTGGVYSVSGTIGQPDAGTMSGGNYSVARGFWGIVSAIQTPGAPLLSIAQSNGTVTVFWSLPASGFVLDQTSALTGSPLAWTQAAFLIRPMSRTFTSRCPSPAATTFIVCVNLRRNKTLNTQPMKTKTVVEFLAAATWLASGMAMFAQTTAFTYHGRLNNNGAPVTGIYDLRFTIYDAAEGGNVAGGPLPVNVLGVTNGLFTTQLDFGAGVFTGPPRWLEISVGQAGAGNFTMLSPRQELTSSPYSIRAQTAGTAADVSNGSVVKSLNSLRDNVTLAAGANVTLTPDGNTLRIDSFGGGGGSIWSLNGGNAYYNGGNVGLGTTQPQGLLDVAAGATDNSALFVRADPNSYGRGGIIHHQSATYGWQELAQNTGSDTDGFLTFHYVNRQAPGTKIASDVLTLRANGCVGIGTTLPARKLTVYGSTYGIEHTDGIVRLGTYLDSLGGWLGTVSNHKLHFFVNDSVPKMTLDTAGNVGIGTTGPTAKLDVGGDVSGTRLILRADPGAPANAAVLCADPNVLNFVPYNTAAARPLNLIVRDAIVRQLTITGGADLAEPFQMSSEGIPKGAVVIIDDQNPGHLKLSSEAYDKRVAGVVSGANGIKPGISLHQEGAIDGGENVALSGRVYVQADTALGAIKPGDLLTTSATPGHAMKVTDHARAQGAILGKAMGQLKQGKGMVLVLVTLQ
jgi:hypothetical protein